MNTPVDLSNLREMIDGDGELEKALFEEFYLAGEQCIAGLQANVASTDGEAWKAKAHAFKGIALNLGANDLSLLCKQAQEEFEAPQAQKEVMLTHICAAFAAVKNFLQSIHADSV